MAGFYKRKNDLQFSVRVIIKGQEYWSNSTFKDTADKDLGVEVFKKAVRDNIEEWLTEIENNCSVNGRIILK